MESLPISKMFKIFEQRCFLLKNFKRPVLRRGFTFIEMILVLSLVIMIALISISLSAPVLNQFSCKEELSMIKVALERARQVSRLVNRDRVELLINNDSYEVVAMDNQSTNRILIDQFNRRPDIPVRADNQIIFEKKITNNVSTAIIEVGSVGPGCQKTITVSSIGAII